MVRAVAVALMLALMPTLAVTKEKAPLKLKGTYAREVDGRKVSFTFQDGTMTFKMNDVKVKCAYALVDDLLFATVTEVESNDGGPEVRDLFSFRVALDKNELTFSELKGTRVSDEGTKIVEGTFKKE